MIFINITPLPYLNDIRKMLSKTFFLIISAESQALYSKSIFAAPRVTGSRTSGSPCLQSCVLLLD